MDFSLPASLNYLDLAIILILSLFALYGLYRGMLYELGSLAVFFAGILVAGKFYQEGYNFFNAYIENPALCGVVAYAALFVGAALVTGILVGLLRRVLHLAMLGRLDHFLGLFAGLAKGVLICILLLVAFNYLIPNSNLMKNSALVPYFESIMEKMSLWPDEIKNLLSIVKP